MGERAGDSGEWGDGLEIGPLNLYYAAFTINFEKVMPLCSCFSNWKIY